MRNGWATKPLGDVAVVGAGNSAPQDKALFIDGKHPFFRTSDVGRIHVGTLMESEDRLNEQGIGRLTLHPAGTILIPKSGASTFLDHRVILGVDGYVSSHLATVRAKPDVIHTKYLFYYLLTVEARSLGVDTAYPTLSLSQVNAIGIPLSPIPEQQRIVAILDDAFAGLATATANAEKNLENARELFESYLNATFETCDQSWSTKPLEELCETNRIITYGVIKLGKEISGGVPCLRTSNVRWLRIDTEGMKRISPDLSKEFRRTVLQGGEVLVNVRGTLGGVAVAAPEMKGWNVSREVAVVPVDWSRIEPTYLAHFIGTRRSQNWLTDVQKGLAYVGINIADLRTLPISFPERKVQVQLVEKLQDVSREARKLEAMYDKRLSFIAELRHAILQAAFSGELTSPPSQVIREAAE
jgi:type I restriction enzyme S subunit